MTEFEPRWKKEARGLFFLLIIFSAVPGLLAAYFDIQYHKAGADKPTAEKTVENVQHGRRKYISADEAGRIRLWWTILFIAMPSSILSGIALRYIFNVDIFKQEPMPEWTEKLMDNLKREQR